MRELKDNTKKADKDKIFKELIRKANGKAVLSYDQLHTALTDVQAVINSRPMTYVEEDSEAYPHIPNHILQGHPPSRP